MHKQVPLVSVCITAYNHAGYIIQCVQSVLDQKGDFEIEILVGDDGSSDETRHILSGLAESHPDRIKLFFHPQNLGASDNLCFLISRAQGQFIAHLDGDDYWLPCKLNIQLEEMHNNPSVSAVYSNGIVISNSGCQIGFFNSINHREVLNLSDIVRNGNYLLHSSILYRSKYKNLIVCIPDKFIDFRIHVRLSNVGSLIHIEQKVVGYRYASSSSMSKHMPYLVSKGYWDALVEASKYGCKSAAYEGAKLFWKKNLLRSLISFDISNILYWWKIYLNNNEIIFSRLKLVLVSIASINTAVSIIYKKIFKSKNIVLFSK